MRHAAARHGHDVRGSIEQPHLRAWSTVFRARTTRGAVFLKCCSSSQAHEPALSQLLSRVVGRRVPALIARHPREDWMLLADGGDKLRDLLPPRELLRAWQDVMRRYAEIQIALIGHDRALLATGMADARLDRLPVIVLDLVEQVRLSRAERAAIRRSVPVIERRCAELAELGIGASVQHDDLHDANVLRKGPRTVIFDWGDACVSHPFLSLLIALRAPVVRAKVAASDPRIGRIRDAYLEPFESFAPMPRLRHAASIGRRLGMITRALSWSRAAIDYEDEMLAPHASFSWWLSQLPRAFPPRS